MARDSNRPTWHIPCRDVAERPALIRVVGYGERAVILAPPAETGDLDLAGLSELIDALVTVRTECRDAASRRSSQRRKVA